ncbi:MAG: Hint domain-containing protein, partial [Candidatus Woesearchaeota archaeon]
MVKRKKIKIKDLFDKLGYIQEEQTWNPPKSLKVLSETGYKKVEGLYKTNKRDIIKIKTKNHSVKGVFEHKIMTEEGWKNLIDLHIEDKALTQSGYEKIVEIEKLPKQENAYDLQVENTHSFYTNGILSHNTEMFISLCNLMDVRTLIFFSSIDLAHQTMRRMKKAGIDAGIVQGGNVDEDHKVVMAT